MFRKSVKKMTGVLAATLMIGSLGFTMPVHAATECYSWHFNSTSGTLPTNSNYKNDNEQKYYLTINSGNVSSQNVFGARIRRSADNTAMSNYSTHTSNKKAQSYAYTASANTTTLYYMKGKKDTASTSTTTLDVGGKVTY